MSSRRSNAKPTEIINPTRRRIAQIHEWCADVTEASHFRNPLKQAAVERNFIAIGEAIQDLSRVIDLASPNPDGPWRGPDQFRDCLAHQYARRLSGGNDARIQMESRTPVVAARLWRVHRALSALRPGLVCRVASSK